MATFGLPSLKIAEFVSTAVYTRTSAGTTNVLTAPPVGVYYRIRRVEFVTNGANSPRLVFEKKLINAVATTLVIRISVNPVDFSLLVVTHIGSITDFNDIVNNRSYVVDIDEDDSRAVIFRDGIDHPLKLITIDPTAVSVKVWYDIYKQV